MHNRFLVSPANYDDIGAVLRALGNAFSFDEISYEELMEPWRANVGEALFLNCSSQFADADYVDRIVPTIRRFVERGGTLYASDWALEVVEKAFDTMIHSDMDGDTGTMTCQIVDAGLRETIGEEVDIHFDMPGWRRMIRVADRVRAYVMGQFNCDVVESRRGLPIVSGFRYGEGHVLCTSFHNERQVSEQERQLLQFLVLQPALAQSAAETAETLQKRECQPGKEIFSTVDVGGKSSTFGYEAKEGEGLLYFLNWQGAGVLGLTVVDPNGQVRFSSERKGPPLGYEAAKAASGTWTCYVSAVDIPHDNFPFVLTLATSTGAQIKMAPPPPRARLEKASSRLQSEEQSRLSVGKTKEATVPSAAAITEDLADGETKVKQAPPPPRSRGPTLKGRQRRL